MSDHQREMTMKLPCSTGEFDLTDDMVAALQLKYPHVMVRDECLKASLWLYSRPSFRPVYPLRYLGNWLKKSKPKTVKLHIAGGKMSEHELLEAGRRKGIEPRAGESWVQFARRLEAA